MPVFAVRGPSVRIFARASPSPSPHAPPRRRPSEPRQSAMKIGGRSVDSFLRSVDAKVIGILLYGPDLGLVRERAERLTTAIAGDTADPFRVSEIRPQQLRDEPGLLADEVAA